MDHYNKYQTMQLQRHTQQIVASIWLGDHQGRPSALGILYCANDMTHSTAHFPLIWSQVRSYQSLKGETASQIQLIIEVLH